MGFWTAMVVMVAIVAGTIMSTAKHKAKKDDPATNARTDELEKQVEALKARIVTLEKIVTDPGYDLKKQFKDLEDDKVA